MNWIDEGALYSQISLFLREDLGRGDITTQSIIARNTRARARFVAGENLIDNDFSIVQIAAAEDNVYWSIVRVIHPNNERVSLLSAHVTGHDTPNKGRDLGDFHGLFQHLLTLVGKKRQCVKEIPCALLTNPQIGIHMTEIR